MTIIVLCPKWFDGSESDTVVAVVISVPVAVARFVYWPAVTVRVAI
jgi:hypothetical protein